MKSGNLNFLEPSGPLQACNRTASLGSVTPYQLPGHLPQCSARLQYISFPSSAASTFEFRYTFRTVDYIRFSGCFWCMPDPTCSSPRLASVRMVHFVVAFLNWLGKCAVGQGTCSEYEIKCIHTAVYIYCVQTVGAQKHDISDCFSDTSSKAERKGNAVNFFAKSYRLLYNAVIFRPRLILMCAK